MMRVIAFAIIIVLIVRGWIMQRRQQAQAREALIWGRAGAGVRDAR